jgi:hypothetical protein
MSLNQELAEYSIALTTYEGVYQLPAQLFEHPDHLAIKAANIKEFEEMVRSIRPNSEQLTCIEQDGRFLAAAKVVGAFSLGLYGKVQWLEIIEPKPEKSGIDNTGIDHAEFYYPKFERVLTIFDRRDVNYEVQPIGEHNRANVVFMRGGRKFEFGITDALVSDIVAEEIENGEAYIIAA